MAKQIPTPSLFLLLLLVFQAMMLMMPSEASICETPSRLFTGICFSRRNCGSICEKEGFSFGRCKGFKCVCAKDCNAAGGGGGDPGLGPPDQGPPEQGPPDQGPPEQGPPDQGPPEQGPPDQGPPEQGPPEQGPPEQGPPGGEEPPVRN